MKYETWKKSLTKEQKIGYKIMYPNLTYNQMFKRMINRFGLILKPPLILTNKQIYSFKKDKTINPITSKKIKKNSKTYIKIKEAYERSIR
tara:strand:- start:212 stop:481 length:270 start_codon:yes stop_codon:yes gene_type:complete